MTFYVNVRYFNHKYLKLEQMGVEMNKSSESVTVSFKNCLKNVAGLGYGLIAVIVNTNTLKTTYDCMKLNKCFFKKRLEKHLPVIFLGLSILKIIKDKLNNH